jgi:hypothetical protein
MNGENKTEIIRSWNLLLEEEFDDYISLDEKELENIKAGKEDAVNKYPRIAKYLQAIKPENITSRDEDK